MSCTIKLSIFCKSGTESKCKLDRQSNFFAPGHHDSTTLYFFKKDSTQVDNHFWKKKHTHILLSSVMNIRNKILNIDTYMYRRQFSL